MHIINTPKAPTAVGPYSQGVLSQGFLFVSGQISIEPETNTLALFEGDIQKQTLQVFANLLAILNAAGCSKNDVVKTTILLTDINDFAIVNTLYANFFEDHKPARATYAVAALPKGANIEIEAIACCTSTPP